MLEAHPPRRDEEVGSRKTANGLMGKKKSSNLCALGIKPVCFFFRIFFSKRCGNLSGEL